jgi:hypothetical protein
MHGGTIYILVEGNDDERFFETVLSPAFRNRGQRVKIWKYAREKRSRTEKFIRTLHSSGFAYIFVRDIDRAPSVRAKQQEVTAWYHHAVPKQRIAVVVVEIESWYLAGLDEHGARRIGLAGPFGATDGVTKEDFNALVPEGMSRIHFMRDILRHFDIETAQRQNRSFAYFTGRWLQRTGRPVHVRRPAGLPEQNEHSEGRLPGSGY